MKIQYQDYGAVANVVITSTVFEFRKHNRTVDTILFLVPEVIARMQFSDIWDGCLHVHQSKTGAKLAIPLTLRCDAIGLSLDDVISRCRDRILSKFVIHHHHTTSQAKRGDPVADKTITSGFSNARNRSGLIWENGTPPTFHEQRSLAERLYREQGVNTQHLLGHKNQAQTDKYNDDRGKEWLIIAV